MTILNLIINDADTSIHLSIEKEKLISLNEYFKTLLSNDYKEGNQKEIIITVPNAIICKNIIEGSCIYDDIRTMYKYIKCFDYWNMEFGLDKILQLTVEEKDFDVILDIAEVVGYHDNILRIIANNLPRNYDVEKFPIELIYEIVEKMKKNKDMNRVEIAARNGYTNILQRLHSDLEFKYSDNAINWASANGHINVLEWFKNSNLEFKYTTDAIDWASNNGHTNVLNWFKNSSLEFKYSNHAIKFASSNGHIDVLDWFKNSNLEFRYSKAAIDMASKNNHINVLEWFKNSNLEFKYSKAAIDLASKNNHINILEWFKNSHFEFKYTRTATDLASKKGHINVLHWFKNNGYYIWGGHVFKEKLN